MKNRNKASFPKSLAGLLIFFLFLSPALPGGAIPKKEGEKWAVVIGIDTYTKEITPLRCAGNDAREFRKTLIQSAKFKEDNIFLLTSDQQGNRLPDKASIIRWISYIKQNSRPEDTFVFFFSGHGMDMDRESYLLTMESDPFSRDTLDASALKIEDLKKYLEEMKAGKKLLFIDACRNDPHSGKGEGDNIMSETFSKNLVITAPASSSTDRGDQFSATFFSCKVGQRSYEWTEKSMGFFTYYLVKGLSGEARGAGGGITLNARDTDLGSKVPEAVRREGGNDQNTWALREGYSGAGDWAVSSAGAAHGRTTPDTPPASRPSKTSTPAAATLPPVTPAPPPAQQGTGSDTIIALCTDNRYAEAVSLFTAHPEYLNKPDSTGGFPLIWAILNKRPAMVKKFIEMGAKVNIHSEIPGDNRQTPLNHAVNTGMFELVKILVEHGAHVNQPDDIGNTPLHYAVDMGNTETVRFLISSKANVNALNRLHMTPLHTAIKLKLSAIEEILRQNGARVK